MAIVKASYTRKCSAAKAATRYIENRPGKDGVRVVRTLFTADGKVQRREVYTMIDQADKTSYFFRLVISPDPKREDSDKNLSLREITERTMQSLENRFQQPVQWVAAIHADHAEHRHIHALAIVPKRLTAHDFLRYKDYEVIGFHRSLPPFKLARMDWRQHPILQKRRTVPAPELPTLAPLAELSMLQGINPSAYIDPDR